MPNVTENAQHSIVGYIQYVTHIITHQFESGSELSDLKLRIKDHHYFGTSINLTGHSNLVEHQIMIHVCMLGRNNTTNRTYSIGN